MEGSICCPISNNCTVFINDVTHNEIIGHKYRNLYCLQVNKKYKNCKRYNAFIKWGKLAPRNVLPNSLLKIEDISDL
jgi:hypothetical protein